MVVGEILGQALYKEQFTGPSLHVTSKEYHSVAEALKEKMVADGTRRQPKKAEKAQQTLTAAQADIAQQVLDRAKESAQSRYADYEQKAKKGSEIIWRAEAVLGKIPVIGGILAAPQNLAVHNWYKREMFDSERMHLNVAGEYLAEEIPFVGDVRSALKAITKFAGIHGWDGEIRRSFSGGIDDIIGIIPEVPESLLELGLEKGFEEPATIAWSRRNKNKFMKMATEIAVAKEMTRIRHENHYEPHSVGLLAKVLIGSSRA